MRNIPAQSLMFALVILSLLSACAPQTPPLPTPGPNFKGFGFTVDPAANRVTPFVIAGLNTRTAAPQGETRVLVNGVDFEVASFDHDFMAGNILEISALFGNLTEAFAFQQPVAFTPDPELTFNIESSSEPTVTDADLGGDGVLSPGETTGPLLFVVEHRGEPFTYFLNIGADVEELPDEADLAILKTDDADPVLPGDTVSYTVTVDNAGPRAAQGVVVTDTLPAEVTFVSSSGCAEDPAGVPSCTVGTIGVGESAQITIEVTVNSGALGTITNLAQVDADTPDPVPGNNTASEDTEVSTPQPPSAADDTVAASSSPGDALHTALDTPLEVADGSGEDLDANDALGLPQAAIVSFGGGDVGGAVGDNPAGSSAGCGGGCSLTVNADGSFVFSPAGGFTGLFSFDYRLENVVGFADATVTLAVGIRPEAVADSYEAIGNVGLGATAGNGVLANDAGDQLAVLAFDANSAMGGVVSVAGNGSFSYDPPPGFEGSDSFGYQLGNGFGNASEMVSITVDEVIWFVDNSQVSQGDGRLGSPFNSLGGSGYSASAAVEAGDIVFLYSGSGDHDDGIVLLDDQILIGQGATDPIAAIAGFSVPAASSPLPATGGSSPTIVNSGGDGITLAGDNTVRGLDIGATVGSGLVGSLGASTLTVSEVAIGGSGGGVDLSGGTVDVSFTSLSASSSSAEGIRLNDVSGSFGVSDGIISTSTVPAVDIDGASLSIDVTLESVSASGAADGILLRDTSGSFTVSGSGSSDGSGGSIDTIADRGASVIDSENVTLRNMTFSNAATGNGASCTAGDNSGCNAAIHLEGSSGIELTNIDISGSAQQGINGLDVADFALTDSSISGCGDEANEACLRLVNLAGTATITDSDLSFAAERVAQIENTDVGLDLTVSGSTFSDTQSSGIGADGLEIVSNGGASTTVAIGGSSFLRNRTNGLQVIAADTSIVGVDVTGSTFDRETGIGIGMDLAATDAATLDFNVIGNPLITSNGGSVINVFADGSPTVQGRINDNPDIQAGGPGSGGFGIRVAANGDAVVVVEIADNTISNIGFDAGIEILSRLGTTGRADATISGNTVTVDATSLYDIWAQAQDSNVVCANVTDNGASGAGVAAFRARTVDAGAEIILQGTGASATAVWDDGGNTPAGSVSSSHNGTLTLGGSCATVSHPTP